MLKAEARGSQSHFPNSSCQVLPGRFGGFWHKHTTWSTHGATVVSFLSLITQRVGNFATDPNGILQVSSHMVLLKPIQFHPFHSFGRTGRDSRWLDGRTVPKPRVDPAHITLQCLLSSVPVGLQPKVRVKAHTCTRSLHTETLPHGCEHTVSRPLGPAGLTPVDNCTRSLHKAVRCRLRTASGGIRRRSVGWTVSRPTEVARSPGTRTRKTERDRVMGKPLLACVPWSNGPTTQLAGRDGPHCGVPNSAGPQYLCYLWRGMCFPNSAE